MTLKAIIISLVVIVAGGAGIYLWQNSSDTTVSPGGDEDRQANSAANTSTSGKKTLQDLVGLNQSIKCTFRENFSGVDTSGTAYVAGGKVRADMDSMMNGQTIKAHMIFDGSNIYTWTDLTPTGFKMSANATQKTAGISAAMDQQVAYDCQSWSASASVFTPPAIRFMESGSFGSGG